MSTRALSATLLGPRDLRLSEHVIGDLGPGLVRVAFGAGGICGSDMHYFRHARSGDVIAVDPLVLGHEVAGWVEDINGDAAGLKIGDRVAINPARPCGACARCREGRINLCDNVIFMGSAARRPHVQGGFATFFDVTPRQCVIIPDNVDFSAAALAEPLAVALHALARAGDVKDARVLVMGAGPIGLLIMLALRHAGVGEVAVADIAAAPLAFARKLGADTVFDVSEGEAGPPAALSGGGFDIVFEAAGSPAALGTAVTAVRRGGTVVQVGNLSSGPIAFAANTIMAKELDMLGSYRFGGEFQTAVRLIAAGAIDVRAIITARRPLTEAPDAFLLALDRAQSVKVVLTSPLEQDHG